jgi:hypothetical protein
MRHYDRAELRRLDDSDRYRDDHDLFDDALPASEPPSMRELPHPAAPPAVARPAAPARPRWRRLLAALLHPVATLRTALTRRSA